MATDDEQPYLQGVAANPLPDGSRAILATAPPVPLVAQLGVAGIREYNGYISEEFLTQLRGREAVRVFTEMASNDAIVSAMLYACAMLIRKAKWRVEPAKAEDGVSEAEAEAEQKFVEGVMEDMSHSWPTFIEECTSFLTFGYAAFEIVYKLRVGPDERDHTMRSRFTDRRIGIRKLAIRSQDSIERWVYDADGTLSGVEQRTEQGQFSVMPIEKMLLFRTVVSRGNPEGRSVLRGGYVSYVRKKAIEDAEGRAALRAAGIVVLRIPGVLMSSEADAEQVAAYSAYKTLVTNIAKDRQGGLILPSDSGPDGKPAYDLQYIVGDGRRSTDFSAIITRHNQAMATSILADFIFLGQQSVGSFALSSDKTQLFATALGAYLRGMEEVLNRHLLPRLWKLNNLDPKTMPAIKASEVEKPSLAEVGTYLQALASAGAPIFPDKQLEEYVREIADFPERSEADIETTATQVAIPESNPVAQPVTGAPNAAQAAVRPPKAPARRAGNRPPQPAKRV